MPRFLRSTTILALLLQFAGPAIAQDRIDYSLYTYTETIHSAGFVGDRITIALDGTGAPHVAYWDFNNFILAYATRTGGVWATEGIEASVFLGGSISIAVDSQGDPHVAYHKATGVGDSLRYASKVGGVWVVENVDGANVGPYCSLALDSQDRPRISYHDVASGDLKYARKDGAWSVETAHSTGIIGLHTDLVIDSHDRPHIAYADDNGDTYYATKVGSVWYREDLPGAGDDLPTGLALSASGTPYVAATNSSGAFLQVQRRTGSGWLLLPPVPTPTFFTYDGSIALGPSGRVHLLYRDQTVSRNDLWHAHYDSTWTVEPLVLTGSLIDIGGFNDLALDANGNLAIAYQDATNGDAMFADTGVKLSSPLPGTTWPVGSQRSIEWRGAGEVDLMLSTDGGASYSALASGVTGGSFLFGGRHTFTVPHSPSRFCKVKIMRTEPSATAVSDSLFTIESSVSLLSLLAAPLPHRPRAARISWSTNPGPEDLAGYRLERGTALGNWTTIVPLTRETSFIDEAASAATGYRLFAVNGLGEELLLGDASFRPSVSLAAWPLPYRDGAMKVTFATFGGLGGGSGPAELTLHDIHGRFVRRLAQGLYRAGYQSAVWDGLDARGRRVAAGVYFLRSQSAGQQKTLKLTVLQ